MERWLSVVGFDGFYDVSDHGRVRSVARVVDHGHRSQTVRSRVLKLIRKPNGYVYAALHRDGTKRQMLVQRLVLEAFVGPCPPGMEARHFPDSDQTNNHLTNLSWSTHEVNEADKVLHGTHLRGERVAGSKLTPDTVRELRRLRGEGVTEVEVAARLGVSKSRVWSVMTGRSWAWVQ